jgi:hypothetical protein
LLSFSNAEDDETLLTNSQNILGGIDQLNDPVVFNSCMLMTNVELGLGDMGYNELLQKVRDMGTFGDKKQFQFRS